MASNKHDFRFITEPSEKLKCVICFEVARDPKQHEDCGKVFCCECIEKNGNKPCPNCRGENPKYFKDRRGDQEIRALHVRCDNVERGCHWEGTVGTFKDHATTCKFTLVFCPNKCKTITGSDAELMRRHLDNHLKKLCPNRDYKCKYCGEKGAYKHITESHDKICAKKVVPCPNTACSVIIERGKTKEHVETVCKYNRITCKYRSIGCSMVKMRKDMKQHKEEDDKAHLHLALEKIVTINKTVSTHERKLKTLKDGESLVFKLLGFNCKKRNNEQFYSEPFYTSPEGYQTCIIVDANGYGRDHGTHVSVFAEILKGCYDDKLCWPFKGTIIVDLLNQLADDNHQRKTMAIVELDDALVGMVRGISQFIPHSELSCSDHASKTQYLMEDILYFRVTVKMDDHKSWLEYSVKLDSMFKRMIEDDQTLKEQKTLTFNLPCYFMRKATDDIYSSEPFYTSPTGYKMSIVLYSNGDGDGQNTHVSVFSKIVKGPYDDILRWPCMGTMTFELLNQLEDKNHHSMVLGYGPDYNARVGSIWGFSQFISHSALMLNTAKHTQYLMDDTLYFRVTVKVDDHNCKPWLDCMCHTN